MKKNVAFLLLFIIPLKNWSCSWYSPDLEYYNLFMQEIINDPEYYPFLRTDESSFYQTKNEENLHNENIEEWQQYLNINYEQAHYLVFEASRESIKGILNGEGTADPKLAFADAQFIKKHTQALRYISYAKYLAPYMTVVRQGGTTCWGEETQQHAGELDYDHVISVLKKSWNVETDKELKLRYGYQLVRFAHYNLKFQEALDYFDEYVEILDYKPVMYYYAVDQKGGAERALQNYIQANQDFFQFFIHTKNRKQSAYSSMRVTDGANFEELLQNAKTPKEKNDIYLLLGYNDFNNPLSSFDKIVAQSPNAVQAKVLMARAINQLERDYFPLTYYCPYDHEDCAKELDSRRLPITSDKEAVAFLEQTLEASERQLLNPDLKDKDFWNLTSAYLYFIQKKYKKASTYLADVKGKSDKYVQQKNKLQMLVDISEQKMITTQFEEHLFKEYGAYFTEEQAEDYGNYYAGNTTKDFIIDILANRYFLQEDYGKAFLLQNSVTDLEYNPDLKILLAIEKLHDKSNKNAFEKYITNNITPTVYIYEVKKFQKVPDFNFEEYVAQMKGSIYLRLGKLKEAKKEFKKVTANFTLPRYYSEDENGKTIIKKQTYDVPYDGYSNIKRDVFGTNRIECFTCEGTVDTYYLEEFPFIKPSMNKAELTDALIQLDKIAEKKDELAAKANYLLGNFYFNTSTLGYFRQLLTFDITNDNSPKFSRYRYFPTSYSAKFYFKNYSNEAIYIDDFKLPLAYLDKGLALAQDKELKAKLLFTAAKAEQGLFYDEGEPIFLEQHGKDGIYSEEYRIQLLQYKAQNYRSYFEKLKNYSDTQYYEEVKSNCNFFDYYVTHY